MMAAFSESAVHHCEVVCDSDEAHGGPRRSWAECEYKDTHTKYLSVDEFGIKHLPPKWRTEKIMNTLINRIDRTGKVNVSHISENRPDTFTGTQNPYPFYGFRGNNNIFRCGTGYVSYMFGNSNRDPCPCLKCKELNQPKMEYWKVVVITSTHVVFDSKEAKSSVVELFYDNENKEGIRRLYGVDVLLSDNERHQTDKCKMLCVTHEKDLVERLKNLCECRGNLLLLNGYLGDKTGVLVSHPHGVCKKISVGKMTQIYLCVKPGDKITLRKGTRVRYDKQEDAQHSGYGCVNDSPKHKQDDTLHHDNPVCKKSRLSIKSEETVTSSSHLKFQNILSPTNNKDVFELKIELYAFPEPLPESVISCDVSESPQWYTLPPNITYKSLDGMIIDDVPMKTKFYGNVRLCNLNPNPSENCFVTYNMTTCPGSSGAIVYCDDYMSNECCHFGRRSDKNQSGYWRFWMHDLIGDYSNDYSDDDDEDDDDDDDSSDDDEV